MTGTVMTGSVAVNEVLTINFVIVMLNNTINTGMNLLPIMPSCGILKTTRKVNRLRFVVDFQWDGAPFSLYCYWSH